MKPNLIKVFAKVLGDVQEEAIDMNFNASENGIKLSLSLIAFNQEEYKGMQSIMTNHDEYQNELNDEMKNYDDLKKVNVTIPDPLGDWKPIEGNINLSLCRQFYMFIRLHGHIQVILYHYIFIFSL